jgi:hypothetical protein
VGSPETRNIVGHQKTLVGPPKTRNLVGTPETIIHIYKFPHLQGIHPSHQTFISVQATHLLPRHHSSTDTIHDTIHRSFILVPSWSPFLLVPRCFSRRLRVAVFVELAASTENWKANQSAVRTAGSAPLHAYSRCQRWISCCQGIDIVIVIVMNSNSSGMELRAAPGRFGCQLQWVWVGWGKNCPLFF